MKKRLISLGLMIGASLPILTMAADPDLNTYFGKLATSATSVLSSVLIFLVSLAVVWFIWNVISYTMSSDEGGKEKAKSQMIWGIIAIAVIVSVWGLVSILQSAFGAGNKSASDVLDSNKMIPSVTQ